MQDAVHEAPPTWQAQAETTITDVQFSGIT
jgi:hypothetical protein